MNTTFMKLKQWTRNDPWLVSDFNEVLKKVEDELGQRGINARWFGAVGDGKSHPISEQFISLAAAQVIYPHATSLTDEIDWCAIQGALNYVEKSNTVTSKVVTFAKTGKTYKINKPLKVNVALCVLQSDGGEIDASQITNGESIRCYGGNNVARQQSHVALKGFRIIGNRNANSIGILMKGDTKQTPVSWITVENLNISNFSEGITYQENAHQIGVLNSGIYNCDTCVHVYEAPNNAERLTFFNTTMSDSKLNILMESASGSIKLTSCSLDYSERYIRVLGGRVTMMNGHIEGSADVDYGLFVTGNSSQIQIIGTEILPGTRMNFAFGYCDASVGLGGITIRDCHMFGSLYKMPSLIEGEGKTVVNNLVRYQSDNRFILATSLNALGNGNFDSTKILSDIIFTTEAQPVLDTSVFFSGNASLLFKTEGSNKGYCEADTIGFNVHPGNVVNFYARYKSSGLGTGTLNNFTITYYFKDSAGNILKTGVRTIESNADNWLYILEGGLGLLAPKGADKISFKFRTGRWDTLSSHRFWLDEFNVNIQ